MPDNFFPLFRELERFCTRFAQDLAARPLFVHLSSLFGPVWDDLVPVTPVFVPNLFGFFGSKTPEALQSQLPFFC